MWPFHRRQPADPPVISNHLGETPPPTPSPTDRAMAPLRQAQSTLADITQMDNALVKDIITETSTLQNVLDALLANMHSSSSNLNEYEGQVESAYLRIKNTVGQAPDIILRRFTVGRALQLPALLAFADGMVDNIMVDQDTLRLLELYEAASQQTQDMTRIHQFVSQSILAIGHISTEKFWDKLMSKLTYGSALVFIEGASTVLVLDTVKFTTRSVERAESERTIKGPQEAFNEIILTHMNQIRRRIRSPRLMFDTITLGSYTQTTVIVAHIEGLTNPALVEAIKTQIGQIKRDYVQQLNEVSPYLIDQKSLFPQVRMTERVDWAVRDVLNGKVIVMVDNDPFVMTVPTTLMDFYQTTQDYVFSTWEGSLVRLIRLIGLMVGLFLMPLYIAVTSVEPDLIPTKLALTIAGSREGIPFPPLMEVIIMWIIIEILREAANRLPKELATTLGTVGAVVVGTAIVKAGIVDDLMIITVTLTALGLFTTPTFEMTAAWRWLFWVLIGASYIFGILGIALVTAGIIAHMASLENFGVPYLSPFGPLRFRDLKDSWIRSPIPTLVDRPIANRPVDIGKAGPPEPVHALDLFRAQEKARR